MLPMFHMGRLTCITVHMLMYMQEAGVVLDSWAGRHSRRIHMHAL